MIYFETSKKERGVDFIDINIPSSYAQLESYYKLRRDIFCEEQQLFENNDIDAHDLKAIPIIAANYYLGAPDQIVGVVRIYEEQKGEWFGGRLGVDKSYRTFSKFICPHLFKSTDISALYHMSVAAGLIYRAVSLANFIGCHKFSAYVQEQNVKLFKRLHWNVVDELEQQGKKHFLMEANLEAYPATPIYTKPIEANSTLSLLAKVA